MLTLVERANDYRAAWPSHKEQAVGPTTRQVGAADVLESEFCKSVGCSAIR